MEIRVICDRSDEVDVIEALRTVLDLDPVRRYRTRDSARVRLYTTAVLINRTPDVAARQPEAAYADAPSLVSEIGWVARCAADRAAGEPVDREFWLRKAAVLDRIALDEAETYAPETAANSADVAEKAAAVLADFDHAHHTTRGPLRPLLNTSGLSYRPYVRQEYLAWNTKRTDS